MDSSFKKLNKMLWVSWMQILPILNIAVIPEFRNQGIGSMMLDQLLQEAGAIFEQISVSVLQDSKA